MENAPIIRSTSNILYLMFRSDGSVQRRGFHLQYSTVCQNTLKGFRGVIESPNFPNNYPFVVECTWTIQVSLGNKVNLSFAQFDLLSEFDTTKCDVNYVQIKYESEEEMINYDTYCGIKAPSLITINSAKAVVHFVSNTSLVGNGFRLEWQIEGCGGELSRPSGTISTPNYPNSYPSNTQCDWLIKLDYGHSIQITFEEVDLELSTNCNFDYILVTNGIDDTYPVLSKICSKGAKPITLTSTGNSMFVRFASDFSYHGRGFKANYTSVDTKCGGKLSSYAGSFHSPNYPQNYDKNDLCEWLIEIEKNHLIELTFSSLDLADDCDKDFIKIFDGPSAGYPLLQTICGKEKPSSIKSTGNYITVELHTGREYTAKGFLANYTTNCGARIESLNSGLINLHDKTFSSLTLDNCSWTIVNKIPSEHVTLVITHMDSFECSDTNYPLMIYNGESKESPLIAGYCSNKLPAPITSSGNALHIELTNIAINFAAKYYMVDTECGGIFTAESGNLATPRYPNSYPMDIQCEWTIQTAPGNRFTISFNEFDLIPSENCHLDYVEIREENSSGKLLGTFCNTSPKTIETIGTVWILFKSGHSGEDGATGKGFLAEYSLIHGINLEGPFGKIASPLYPRYQYKTEKFSWTITVTFGKAIMITFLDFYLETYNEGECFLTTLEVYDGYDSDAPLLANLCGITTPEPVKSTSNVMNIKLNYDSVIKGSRFLLEWTEIDIATKESSTSKPIVEGCGSKEVIDMSVIKIYNLTSPGFPYGYQEDLNCEWIFSTKPGYHVAITFRDVDLEVYSNICTGDEVKIYNKVLQAENWKLIAEVCHINHTGVHPIHGSDLTKIVFTSDSAINKTGFEAQVRQMCGGSLYDSDGIISTNDTDFKYRFTCEWNVTVQTGRTIQVTFLELNLESTSTDDKCENYVMLRNGHYPDSPFLGIGKYCSNEIPELLNTTGNYLYVKYFGYPEKYFTLSYKEMSQNCGGSHSLSKQLNEIIISSPNYPNVPPPFTECYWTIRAPPGEALRVDFIERFDVTKSYDCTKAAVQIRDGGSKFSPLIDQFCNKLPNSTFSTDNMINIRFFTTLSDPGNGFKAKVTIASCGGVVRGKIGEVHSPNFNIKSQYPQNSECIWHLQGVANHNLILKFNSIDLPEGEYGDCLSTDHVTLEEEVKFNDSINIIGVYCGNLNPGEIRSSTNDVIVRFVSGNTGNNLAGFSLTFNISQEQCGGVLNTESGIIESPGYPESNYNNIECEWNIQVPEGRRIKFEFIDFDMAVSGYNQGIMFHNDQKLKSLINVKTRKGWNSSIPILSSGNMMNIYFWNGKATTHRGFHAKYTSDEPTICTGDFSKSNGVIRNINESTYYCVWKHVAAESQTLAMTVIANFNESKNELSTCKYPRAAIIITFDNEFNKIATFCTTTKEPVIIRSPYTITKLIGFQNKRTSLLQYTINYAVHSCGGIIKIQDGFISTPNYPQKPGRAFECAWVIKLPDNQKIDVNFVNVDLDKNCEYNYITIYNGESPTSPKIGHFCESNKPTSFSIQGNTLLIEYHADERSTGTGFKMLYQPVIGGCGGIFHDSTRIIESPSYPKEYPNNAECTWEIIGQNGYFIQFNFIDRFYIEESKNCENDFIEIWNYIDEWISLGKNCGRHTPQLVNSTSNHLKIVFRSNDKITATGFKAQWNSHCGGVFTATAKNNYILSPGYPNDYNNSLTCIYTIMPQNEYVNILFEDFALEKGTRCQFDNITVKTDDSYEEPIVYCGTKKPLPIRATSNVTITFKTDPWISRRGFKMLYRLDDCGGIVKKPMVISSPESIEPNSIGSYPNMLNCYWNITAPSDKIVVVKFNHFDLEHNPDCYYDFVEIFEGATTNQSQRLALLCGNLSSQMPIIKSKSNLMTIHLKSDYSNNNFAGFRATVYFSYGPKEGCGGTINVETTKTLEAPYGRFYFDCQWEIFTTRDYNLKIKFTELNLETNSYNNTIGDKGCIYNSIELKDGGPFSNTIERICNDTIPAEIITTSHMAWIRLFTLGATKDKSFKLTLTKIPSVCGSSVLNVTNQTKELTSPRYPNPYPNNIRCKWILKAPNVLDKIRIRFLDFDLVEASNHERCNNDKVQIADKQYHNIITEGLGETTIYSGANNPVIYDNHYSPVGVHEYCGKHALHYYHYSGDNQIVVSFISGYNEVHGNGFKLEYELAGCNRNFTSVQGRILLSDFDFSNACTITVTAPENFTISLYFLAFAIYDVDECQTSGIEVYDGNSKSAKKLVKLCGFNIPDPIFSSSNKILIYALNNGNAYYHSLDITYTSTPNGKGCGGIFYNYAGKFTSPLYPKEYREKNTCIWEVKVPQGMMASLKFTVFDINGSTMEITTFKKDGSPGTVHHYTGTDTPAIIKSENNRLTVKYITTLNSGGSGWVANFLAVTTDTIFDKSM